MRWCGGRMSTVCSVLCCEIVGSGGGGLGGWVDFGDGMGMERGWEAETVECLTHSHWLLRYHLLLRLGRRIFERFGGGVCPTYDVLCGMSRGCGLCGDVRGCWDC